MKNSLTLLTSPSEGTDYSDGHLGKAIYGNGYEKNFETQAENLQQMLHRFVETGESPNDSLVANDPLREYVARILADTDVKAAVLNDKLCERIFFDTMSHFITLCLEKARYHLQCTGAERKQIAEARQWTLSRRADGWRALVQMANERCKEQGFERGFFERKFGEQGLYTDDTAWDYFLNEWENNLNERLHQQAEKIVKEQSVTNNRLLSTNLKAGSQYASAHGINENEFCQVWALMGGRWNSLEYERLARVARLQVRYPQLIRITNRMGRMADPQGLKRIGFTSGYAEKLPMASHSDIAGVSMGRELGALLPTEMAQFLDPQLEDVFLQKYLTSHLQIFGSQSHAANTAQSLHTTPARPRGPMIVCCDTSGSMIGQPFKIALSLMMRLSKLASRQHRECLLIAFATDARPINVLTDRTLLLRFFSQRAQGYTDARQMIDLLYTNLYKTPRYTGADVLWVTDFRIPIAPQPQLAKMKHLQNEGTRFYGLQIGIAENRWKNYFNEMEQIS